MKSSVACLFALALFMFSLSSFAQDLQLNVGESLNIGGRTVSCGEAVQPQCNYISGYGVYCGHGCKYISGYGVYCAKTAAESCDYISGYGVYCGHDCKYISGYGVYCAERANEECNYISGYGVYCGLDCKYFSGHGVECVRGGPGQTAKTAAQAKPRSN